MWDKGLQWFKIFNNHEALIEPVPHDSQNKKLNNKLPVQPCIPILGSSVSDLLFADLASAAKKGVVD